MIRGITVVAIGGAVISVACLGSARALHPVSWHVPGLSWSMGDDEGHGPRVKLTGNETVITRSLPWAGAEAIRIEVPAEITYTQGPQSSITLSGPDALVNHTELKGNALTLNASIHGMSVGRALRIAITAPALHDFTLESAQSLDIRNLATDHLAVTIEGAGKVSAQGSARSVTLTIAGAGDAKLDDLTVQDATIAIEGFGSAVAGPTGNARVSISGAGNVRLTKRPANLTQDIEGAGHVSQPDAPQEQKL